MAADRKRKPTITQETEIVRSEAYSRVYSNIANSSVSAIDFRITFCEVIQADESKRIIREHVTVTMAPEQAKALYELLGKNLKDYEEQVGPIRFPLKVPGKG